MKIRLRVILYDLISLFLLIMGLILFCDSFDCIGQEPTFCLLFLTGIICIIASFPVYFFKRHSFSWVFPVTGGYLCLLIFMLTVKALDDVIEVWIAIIIGLIVLAVGLTVIFSYLRHYLKETEKKREQFLSDSRFLHRYDILSKTVFNKKKDRAVFKKDLIFTKVFIEKRVTENGAEKYIPYKEDIYFRDIDARFFAIKHLVRLNREQDQRPEYSLNYDILKSYCDNLNNLLQEDGFEERFVIQNDTYKGTEYQKLVLSHLTDKNCMIEFVEDGIGMLHFMGAQTSLLCGPKHPENIPFIYKWVKDALTDKVVVVKEYDRSGNFLLSEGICFLNFDIDSFNYTEKEREFLTKHRLEFARWSGFVPINAKLFVIGSLFTHLSEITDKWKESLIMELAPKEQKIEPAENNPNANDYILWQGTPSKEAVVFVPFKICGIMFLIGSLLISYLFFYDWRIFICIEAVLLLTMVFCYFIARANIKNQRITITKEEIIIYYYIGHQIRYRFEDIIKIKIKYSFYDKGKNRGTVKVKIRKPFVFFYQHLYSIPDPEAVYKIIEENRNKVISKK